MLTDGQNDFTGGMNDRLAPERLGVNEYAYGENIEIRDGSARTRRGSFCLYTFNEGYTLNGAGMYYGPAEDQRKETLLQVLGSQVWSLNIPQPPILMATPSSEAPGTGIRFVQAFDIMYMLRGSALPAWKWTGRNNTWAVLTAPNTGDAFPMSEYGIFAYNRIWLVVDRDTVVASDIFSEAFDLTTNSWDINSGEGGKVMAIMPFADGSLLVFKDNSVWLLGNCNGDLSNMYMQVVDPKHGAVSRDAVVRVGNDVWYLSKDGVRSVILTTENNAQLEDVPISFNVPQLFNRIHMGMVDKSQAALIDNYVLFGVPVDGAAENNAMLVYDLLLKKWVGLWTNLTAKRFVTSLENGEGLYYINSLGSIEKMLADTFNDHRQADVYLSLSSSARVLTPGPMTSTAFGFLGQTSGIIEASVRIAPQTTGTVATILYISGPAFARCQVSMCSDMQNVEVTFWQSPNYYWQAHTTTLNLQSNYQRHLSVVHNGSVATLWVDGINYPLTFDHTEDITKWFGYFTAVNVVEVSTYNCPNIDVYDIKITSLNQSSTQFHMGFNEGTGSTTIEDVSGVSLNITGGTWRTTTTSSIATRLDTRAFNFQSPGNKTISRGLITCGHRSPSYTVSYRGKETAWTASGLAAKTYDQTKYDIHGVSDFDYTGSRFNEAYRRDYAPLTLPTLGMLATTSGWQLDQEVEHTEQFNCRLVSPYAQLKVVNTTGTLAVKEIMLQGTGRAPSNKGR